MPSCDDSFMIFSTRQVKFSRKSELNGNKVRKSERKKSKKCWVNSRKYKLDLPAPDGLADGSYYFLVLVVTLKIAKINLECAEDTFWEARKAYIEQ